MALYEIGDIISFSYPAWGLNPKQSLYKSRQQPVPEHLKGTRAHDRNPKVLVLHTNWRGLLHCLNLNYLTNDEINTLRMVLDPLFEMKYRDKLKQKNATAYAELERIINRSGNPRITTPHDFYVRVIKPFIQVRGWDPYRLYHPEKMTAIRVLEKRSLLTGEDSMRKFRAEHGEQAREVEQALNKMKTARGAQRQGILQWFKNRFENTRGPRF